MIFLFAESVKRRKRKRKKKAYRKRKEKKSFEIRMNGISNGPEIQTRLKEANYGFNFIA